MLAPLLRCNLLHRGVGDRTFFGLQAFLGHADIRHGA